MTRSTLRRRHFPAALLLTAILVIAPVDPTAFASEPRYSEVPNRICNIDWRMGRWHVKKLIRCAAWHWGVRGGADRALYIARRESRFRPRAYNSSSGALGIYQHMKRYWPGRADKYGFRDWSGFNARANIIVTMRMVRRMGGWSPWGM